VQKTPKYAVVGVTHDTSTSLVLSKAVISVGHSAVEPAVGPIKDPLAEICYTPEIPLWNSRDGILNKLTFSMVPSATARRLLTRELVVVLENCSSPVPPNHVCLTGNPWGMPTSHNVIVVSPHLVNAWGMGTAYN